MNCPPPFSLPSSLHHRLTVEGQAGSLSLAFSARFSAPRTVLFGPSGCGKSTLLRAMCGLTPGLRVDFIRQSTQGTHPAVLDDADHHRAPEQRQIAYAPQQAVLFPHLTVRENVAFAHSVRPSALTHKTLLDQAIELFALAPLLKQLPRALSGGEQQRVALARAFAVPDAQLLLLDEPFTGLDRTLRGTLLPDLRAQLTARGLPVVAVTHDIEEALLWDAELIRLNDGRNLTQGPAPAVLAPEILELRQTLDTAAPTLSSKRRP